MKYLHVFTVLGAIGGAIQLLSVQGASQASAPQQAAGAAMAAGMAIIPYCFVRAIVAMCTSAEEDQLKKLNETTATHTRLLAELANAAEPKVG